MPTYSYECAKCAHVFDLFHAMSATPKVKCEQCGARCKRLIGSGAGFIFKGSGFYETDFKDKKGTAPAKEGQSESTSGDGKKGEGKPDAKPEKTKADTTAPKTTEQKSEKKAV